jgi:hypothetical protein
MTASAGLSTRVTDGERSLGVLSVHLDGSRCRVGCEFCYLGARPEDEAGLADLELLGRLLAELRWDELAVAVSEPAEAAAPGLAIARAAAARTGRPLAITTTLEVAEAHPALLAGAQRLSLSVDPRKGLVEPRRIDRIAEAVRADGAEIALIVSLITPGFAARLVEQGLLERLCDLPHVDRVALQALKPPPPWCDRAFWLRTLARLRPLLDRALDRRLFLDCYVAARLLGLGGCPARADLSPAAGGFAFRSCVYQRTPDLVSAEPASLARHLRDFKPPAVCPFPIV